MKTQNITYLDGNAMRRLMGKQKRRMILGACLTAFFALATVMALMNYTPEMREGLPVYVGLLIPSVLILLLGFRTGQDLALARRFNSIFAADQDGVVQNDELAAATGMQSGKLSKELERLFRLGLFQGCTLSQSGAPSVLLANAGADKIGFVVTTCPHCGASSRIRVGSSGKCEYCGSAIRG